MKNTSAREGVETPVSQREIVAWSTPTSSANCICDAFNAWRLAFTMSEVSMLHLCLVHYRMSIFILPCAFYPCNGQCGVHNRDS